MAWLVTRTERFSANPTFQSNSSQKGFGSVKGRRGVPEEIPRTCQYIYSHKRAMRETEVAIAQNLVLWPDKFSGRAVKTRMKIVPAVTAQALHIAPKPPPYLGPCSLVVPSTGSKRILIVDNTSHLL